MSTLSYRVLLIAIGALFALNATAFLAAAAFQIVYPYQLDYGEGIVLWQASHVFDLSHAYHPIDRYPFIVFHYPPVYHVISRLAAFVTGDLLIAGRAVSWLLCIGVAIVSGWMAALAVKTPGPSRLVAAIVTPLLMWQLATFDWIPVMRVDITAIFFTLLGLLLFIRAASPVGRIAAGALFIVALFCKQTMIAAPAAAVATLVVTGGAGAAIALTSVMAALGLSTLGALSWWTDGEFARHLFLYNRNPYVVRQLFSFVTQNLSDLGVVTGLALMVPVVAIARREQEADGVSRTWRTWRTWWPLLTVSDTTERAKLCLTLYFLVAGATCVIAGKVGAGVYYFLEWNVACCILAGVTVGELLPSWRTHRISSAGLVVLLMLGVFGVDHLPRTETYVTMLRGRSPLLNARATAAARVLDEIKAVPGPVLSEDMVLLEKANKEIPWEPAIITQLAETGVFDERRALERLEARWFDLVVVRTLDRDPKSYAAGRHLLYTDRMRHAIQQAYEVRARLANGYTILQPRGRQMAATHGAPPN